MTTWFSPAGRRSIPATSAPVAFAAASAVARARGGADAVRRADEQCPRRRGHAGRRRPPGRATARARRGGETTGGWRSPAAPRAAPTPTRSGRRPHRGCRTRLDHDGARNGGNASSGSTCSVCGCGTPAAARARAVRSLSWTRSSASGRFRTEIPRRRSFRSSSIPRTGSVQRGPNADPGKGDVACDQTVERGRPRERPRVEAETPPRLGDVDVRVGGALRDDRDRTHGEEKLWPPPAAASHPGRAIGREWFRRRTPRPAAASHPDRMTRAPLRGVIVPPTAADGRCKRCLCWRIGRSAR